MLRDQSEDQISPLPHNSALLYAGAYGVVHLVIERATGRDFACKVLPKQRGKVAPEKLARKIRTEVELLCRVQVPPRAQSSSRMLLMLRAAVMRKQMYS